MTRLRQRIWSGPGGRWLLRRRNASTTFVAIGTFLSTAAGALVLEWVLNGEVGSKWPRVLTGTLLAAGGLMALIVGFQLSEQRRISAGLFLHVIGHLQRYSNDRYQTEGQAFAAWAEREAAQAFMLPRRQETLDSGTSSLTDGIVRLVEGVRRDLIVGAEVTESRANPRLTLLYTGSLAAGFWLGAELVNSIRLTQPPRTWIPAPRRGSNAVVEGEVTVVADAADDSPESHFPAVTLPLTRLRDTGTSLTRLHHERVTICLKGSDVCMCSSRRAVLAFDAQAREAVSPRLRTPVGALLRSLQSCGEVVYVRTAHGRIDTSAEAHEQVLQELGEFQDGIEKSAGKHNTVPILVFAGPASFVVALGARTGTATPWEFAEMVGSSYELVHNPWRTPGRTAPIPTGPVQLVNRTPHADLTLMSEEGLLALPMKGTVRLREDFEGVGHVIVNGDQDAIAVQIGRIAYSPAADLPPSAPDVLHVVSQLVVEAHPERADLVFPLEQVRSDGTDGRAEGDIIGFRRLGIARSSVR